MRIFPFLLALGCLSIFSCKEEQAPLTPAEQLQKDIGIIEDYLAKNNLVAQSPRPDYIISLRQQVRVIIRPPVPLLLYSTAVP